MMGAEKVMGLGVEREKRSEEVKRQKKKEGVTGWGREEVMAWRERVRRGVAGGSVREAGGERRKQK